MFELRSVSKRYGDALALRKVDRRSSSGARPKPSSRARLARAARGLRPAVAGIVNAKRTTALSGLLLAAVASAAGAVTVDSKQFTESVILGEAARQLIGAGGYGQPILTGIRLDDVNLILQGAVPAAALALLVQGLFELLERRVVPEGLRVAARR